MALDKQSVNLAFGQGLSQKTDPKQLQIGKFQRLVNAVFNTIGLLSKRNGFPRLTLLPDTTYRYITTFAQDLTAIGRNLAAYIPGTSRWVVKGQIEPCRLAVTPLVRTATNQSAPNCAVSANGLVCTAYADSDGSTTTYRYVVADAATGQNAIPPTDIEDATGPARVFSLGNFFVIVSPQTGNLEVIAVNIYTLVARAPFSIATDYLAGLSVAMDGFVASDNLYIAWNTDSTGVKITYLDSALQQHNTEDIDTAHGADYLTVTADITGGSPVIWVAYNNNTITAGYIAAVGPTLTSILAATAWSGGDIENVTATAQNGICTLWYELDQPYTYNSAPNHIISRVGFYESGSAAPVGDSYVVGGMGLAGKAFLVDGVMYCLTAYDSTYQPTYFLLNQDGKAVAKLAYGNGTGYTDNLSSPTVVGSAVLMGYPVRTQIQAVNKAQGVANAAGIYAQTGLNLASFTLTTDNLTSVEIGNVLYLSGGFLWAYDGYSAVEQNFFLWPDNVEVNTSTSGGSITAQQYYYQVVYEWQDNQGNLIRSAPSIPVSVTTTGATSTNTLEIPTLRLTYKTANPVKIVVYRWSAGQQNYYQVTSITSPLLNDTGVDSVQFEDTLADSAILGNSLIYTTGGILENIQAPACHGLALFDTRLFAISSEQPDLLWFSKQVLPSVPVETSDLLTYLVTNTVGTQSPAGPNQCLAPMDDKLTVWRENSIVYMNGVGPDNTGSQSGYSQPIFITSTVGCDNQASLVLSPNGLMFESNKGIWLLGRNLATQYIGADVETLTQGNPVLSALSIPETNQIRFTMTSGITLMYDYYVDQWGTFEGIPGICSTIYEGLHTTINQYGQVSRELPGTYLDASNPVLLSFSTAWINPLGVQGYERFYWVDMLGEYFTPFKLNVSLALDYGAPFQAVQVTPDNYSPAWGGDPSWGAGTPWGGPSALFEARVFPEQQRCKAFQIRVDEIYDPSFGVVAGAGLTLSSLNLIIGAKKKYRPSIAARSFG